MGTGQSVPSVCLHCLYCQSNICKQQECVVQAILLMGVQTLKKQQLEGLSLNILGTSQTRVLHNMHLIQLDHIVIGGWGGGYCTRLCLTFKKPFLGFIFNQINT